MICRLITVQRYIILPLKNKNFSLNRVKLFEHLFTDYQYIILCFYCILLLLFRTLRVRWLRDSIVICLNQSLPQIKISPDLTFLTKSSLGNSGLYHLYDTILPCSLSNLFIISFMSSGSLFMPNSYKEAGIWW